MFSYSFDRRRGHHGQELRDRLLHAFHLAQRHQLGAEAAALERLVHPALEQVVVDLVRRREPRAVDGRQHAGRVLQLAVAAVDGLEATRPSSDGRVPGSRTRWPPPGTRASCSPSPRRRAGAGARRRRGVRRGRSAPPSDVRRVPDSLRLEHIRVLPSSADAPADSRRHGTGRTRRTSSPPEDKATSLQLPFEPLESLPDDASLWDGVPLELMVRHGCVPVRRDGGRLVLAFGGLEDVLEVDEVEFHLGRPIDAVVAPRARVAEILKRHQRRRPAARARGRVPARPARRRRRHGSRTSTSPRCPPTARWCAWSTP